MRVSVIIPTLNSARTLPVCLKSVFNQTHTPFEIIIVDRGSRDETRTIALQAGCLFQQTKCRTIGELRNAGAEKARSSMLAFIDSDCIAPNDWLENAVKLMKKYEAVGAQPKCPKNSSLTAKAFEIHRHNSKSNFLPTDAICIKKKTFKEIGGFDRYLPTCEDCDLSYRMQDAGHLTLCDQRLAPLHLHEPRNAVEFFWKQVWHGSGMLRILLKRKYGAARLKAIAFSVALPLAFALSMGGLQIKSPALAIIPAGTVALTFIVKAYSTSRRQPIWIPMLIFTYALYSIARFYSLTRSASHMLTDKFRA